MNDGYIRVRLLSPQYSLVTDLAIPPFESPPQIILWGNRAFLLSDVIASTYLEVTSYAAPFEDQE